MIPAAHILRSDHYGPNGKLACMSTRHSTPDHYGSADFAFFARPCAAFKTFSGLTKGCVQDMWETFR